MKAAKEQENVNGLPDEASAAPARSSSRMQKLSAIRRPRAPVPLGTNVAHTLERMILDGVLKPGERLNEVALARELGVSRGPVREAARALERLGLVTVIMNRGAFVRQLGLDDAMAIYEINAVLFGLAAGQVAEGLTSGAAISFSRMVDEMGRAIAAGDREAFFTLNVQFHSAIVGEARNREAAGLYETYSRKLLLLRRRSFEEGGHMEQSNAEHRELVEAILAGDGPRARQLGELHVRGGRARFLAAIGRTIGQAGAPIATKLPRRQRRPPEGVAAREERNESV